MRVSRFVYLVKAELSARHLRLENGQKKGGSHAICRSPAGLLSKEPLQTLAAHGCPTPVGDDGTTPASGNTSGVNAGIGRNDASGNTGGINAGVGSGGGGVGVGVQSLTGSQIDR
jgi:hypothetical protein